MGAAAFTKPELKRAIDAGKESGATSVVLKRGDCTVSYNLIENTKVKPVSTWDEKVGLNSTK